MIKLSEYIKKLQALEAEGYGNLPCAYWDDGLLYEAREGPSIEPIRNPWNWGDRRPDGFEKIVVLR